MKYEEIKNMAYEIAALRCYHYNHPDSTCELYQALGIELALEICGYNVTTTIRESEAIVVHVRIFNSEFDEVFKSFFMRVGLK